MEKNKKRIDLKASMKRFFTYNTGNHPRVWELDFIRGLLIIVVTFDHILLFGYYWNMLEFHGAVGEFFKEKIFYGYLESAFRKGVEPFGLWLFALLSGISSSLTGNPAKRAIKTCVFTAVFMGGYALLRLIIPSQVNGFLIFNILTILSVGTLVEWLMQVLKTPNHARFILSMVAIFVGITYFYMHFVRGGFYVNNGFLSLMVYNEHGYIVSPNNFEPLFPHLGFFMFGALLGRYMYKERKTVTSHTEPPKIALPIAYAGKQSLFLYIFGAIIILLPLIAIDRIVGLFY